MTLWTTSQYYPRRVDYIVVHHSAGADGSALDYDDIFQEHTVGNGWLDIGYNAVVEMVDGGAPIVVVGRPDHVIPAHVQGFNDHSLGVCLVGNFSITQPPLDLMKVAARRIVAPWMVQYGVSFDNLMGHRDAPGANTECPGNNFDMDVFKGLVSKYIHQADAMYNDVIP